MTTKAEPELDFFTRSVAGHDAETGRDPPRLV
jgi:hypothetical protein